MDNYNVDTLTNKLLACTIKNNRKIFMFLDYEPLEKTISWRIYLCGMEAKYKSFKIANREIIPALKLDLQNVSHVIFHNADEDLKNIKNDIDEDIIKEINNKVVMSCG